MWKKRRHKAVMNIIRPFFKLHFKLKYNLKIKTNGHMDESFVLLSNHVTSLDPFIVGAAFKDPVYYMASVDLFEHKVIGKLIEYLVHPIPKEKSKKRDIKAIKDCMKVARENASICIFPEGNRNLNGRLGYIDPSIVKLIKALKKPLILFNINGGFGTDPRWGRALRKGKMTASIVRTISYEEYKDMPNEELYDIIKTTLTVDDYNFYDEYKSNKRAEYLERALYICPNCKKMNCLESSGNILKCNNCKLEVEYLPSLRLKANKDTFKFNTIEEWYKYQLDIVINKDYDDTLIYEDDVTLTKPRLYKSKVNLGSGKFKMFKDHFEITTNVDKYYFSFDDIEGITLLGKKKMNIYYNDLTYQIFGKVNINLLKYIHLFYILKNKKEEKNNEFLGL